MAVVPEFRRRSLPRLEVKRAPELRGSRHERGYDAIWTRLSARWRRKHPICRWCEFDGRTVLCDVVDHILPVRDYPALRLTERNLQSLCTDCHALKGRMEEFARMHDRLDELSEWSADPTARPARFVRLQPGQP